MAGTGRWRKVKEEWHVLRHYQRFESSVALVLTLVVALLAIARKFIILDLKEVSAEQLFALAAITLVLGVAYWLLRQRDDPNPV